MKWLDGTARPLFCRLFRVFITSWKRTMTWQSSQKRLLCAKSVCCAPRHVRPGTACIWIHVLCNRTGYSYLVLVLCTRSTWSYIVAAVPSGITITRPWLWYVTSRRSCALATITYRKAAIYRHHFTQNTLWQVMLEQSFYNPHLTYTHDVRDPVWQLF